MPVRDDDKSGATQFSKDLARFNHETVDLEGTLDDLVRVLQRAVTQLRNELIVSNGVAARNQVVTADFGKRLKEVTLALSAATTCQNALRKTAKERAATMTPEERLAAVGRMVDNLGYYTRRRLLTGLCASHNAKRVAALELGLEERDPDEKAEHIGTGPSPTTLFVELK